ncbi:hypothetical protein L211DRAFT_849539 [Terfezia boudieri ATCC MYA-4762]|uniref:Uncharacterized protein n=1 Tax=Terfezia boudieri ATCC MYA-4762 TaxID=1051890 RepID=A0A3N4LZT9_9PEZI|nr:hypothetical protein L211DRAFT_849539 [Terfezia boudieri ATCC MYA-4762]
MAAPQCVPSSPPGSCGLQVWRGSGSVSSSSSFGNALSDITMYTDPAVISESFPSTPLCPPNAQAMADMAEAIIKQSGQQTEAVVIAVGKEARIKSYVTKVRRHPEGANKFRSVVIRELSALIYTYIGYESVPEPLKDTNTEPGFEYNTASFIITRSEYCQFLHANAHLVARTLHLDNNSDAHSLLKLFNFDFYNALNSTVHTVTLSDALDAIDWLSTMPLDKVSTILGWQTNSLAQHVPLFVKAARQLLPKFISRPGYTLQKADAGFILNGHVRKAKEWNRQLMDKARAWGVTKLSDKRRKFFEAAIREGLVPSVSDLQEGLSEKVSKVEVEEVKEDLEKVKEDLDGKAAKEDLDGKASKEDLDGKASKEDLKAMQKQMAEYVAELNQCKAMMRMIGNSQILRLHEDPASSLAGFVPNI